MRAKAARTKRHVRDRQEAATAPQAAQLEAVRRLAAAGRSDEARRRLAELRARFPGFRPLRALAWEVETQAGNTAAACARAWDWSEASPGSMAALEAMRDSAFAAGFGALGAVALKRIAEMQGREFREPAPMPSPFGDLPLEEASRIDLSRMFLFDGRFDDAIAVLSAVDHPAARNNLAIGRFAKGDIADALDIFEHNWQREPRNLFALEQIVRLRLWRRGRNYASGLAAPLRATTPLRAEDAYAQMSGLMLLGAHADADAAWKAAREAEFWFQGTPQLRVRFDYLGGIAALRLGHRDDADERFTLAIAADAEFAPAIDARLGMVLEKISGGIDIEVGEFSAWYPMSWLSTIRQMKGDDNEITAFLKRCDATADYLGLAAELGGAGPRMLALALLKERAVVGNREAVRELRSLLARPCGADKVRSGIHGWLAEKGFLAKGETSALLVGGEIREVKALSMKITAEPQPDKFAPAERVLNRKIHDAIDAKKLELALRLSEQLHAMCPGNPMVLANMASIKEGLGHPYEESEALYRRALEIDPDYLFARAGMAKAYARRGNAEAAKEAIATLLEREEYHYSEWRAILTAQMVMAQETGDDLAALRIRSAIGELQEKFA